MANQPEKQKRLAGQPTDSTPPIESPFPFALVPTTSPTFAIDVYMAAPEGEKDAALQALVVIEGGVATQKTLDVLDALAREQLEQGGYEAHVVAALSNEQLLAVARAEIQGLAEDDTRSSLRRAIRKASGDETPFHEDLRYQLVLRLVDMISEARANVLEPTAILSTLIADEEILDFLEEQDAINGTEVYRFLVDMAGSFNTSNGQRRLLADYKTIYGINEDDYGEESSDADDLNDEDDEEDYGDSDKLDEEDGDNDDW